jgi:hypothetical protein
MCWGKEAVDAADGLTADGTREILEGRDNLLRDGSIKAALGAKAKVTTVTYSTRPPTKLESRANHVRWIAQSKRPFEIVSDPGYHLNMKEGRPHQYIPSVTTLRRDIKAAFAACRRKVAQKLKVNKHNVYPTKV